MSYPSMAQLPSNTLYYKRFFPYHAFNVLAGLDTQGKGCVFTYDVVGSYERTVYTQGTGLALMMHVRDNQLKSPGPLLLPAQYQLIRINSRGLHGNCKWMQMFDDARLVIFCVTASHYDEYCKDANGTIVNKMVESRQLFESIALHPTFEQTDFLLLLTKFDLLEQKINSSPLTSCDWFSDFTPLISRNLLDGGGGRRNARSSTGAALSQMAVHYMATKFKRLFESLTRRKLYVSYMNALDQESVRSAIRYGREIIKWEEEKPVFGASETVYSEEPSSFTA